MTALLMQRAMPTRAAISNVVVHVTNLVDVQRSTCAETRARVWERDNSTAGQRDLVRSSFDSDEKLSMKTRCRMMILTDHMM